MTDKTHQLIGLSAATYAILHTQPDLSVTWSVAGTVLLGSFVGSILPDIDQPTSDVWDVLPLGGILGKITSRALGGHRNLSHSLLGILLFTSLIILLSHHLPEHGWLVPSLFVDSFLIGFIAHLLADSVTVMGIPIFWPFGGYLGFPPQPLQGLRIVTGKWFENLIIFPAVSLLFVALILQNIARFCPILPFICHT